MRGRVGVLCLSSWQADSVGLRETEWSSPNEDKHKAPTSTPPYPLSLQDGGRRDLSRPNKQNRLTGNVNDSARGTVTSTNYRTMRASSAGNSRTRICFYTT